MFNKPIPGESLTSEPGKYPWERPPQMEDINEIADHYLSRLNKPDAIDDILDLVEMDIPIEAIAGALVTNSVSKGLHSIDAGILIGPVVHEFIRTAADKAGISYVDNYDPDKIKAKRQQDKMSKRLRMKIEEMRQKNLEGDKGMQMMAEMAATEPQDMTEEQPMMQEEQPAATPAPRGLMSRGM